jgi:hypothetical protein
MTGAVAAVAKAVDDVGEAISGGELAWLLPALCVHITAQICRSFGWYYALDASWPGISRRRASAWYLAGAGLSGLLSGRGGDAVRLALAKRELPDASWPALVGTAVVEVTAQGVASLAIALIAIGIGVHALPVPALPLLAVGLAAVSVIVVVGARTRRMRRLIGEFVRGCAALRHPRRYAGKILGWELAAKLLRLGAVACFLQAFALPVTLPVVVTVALLYGSGNVLPIPGAGTAASAGALLVAVPIAAGHPVDSGAVEALVIAQPVLLSVAGIAVSLGLLGGLLGIRTPAALLEARRALAARPSVAG